MSETNHGATRTVPKLTVIGVGAEGIDGLSVRATQALLKADHIIGSQRQLDLVPVNPQARRQSWPSPLMPTLEKILDEVAGLNVVILASGDPMNYGIGATLSRIVGAHNMEVIPAPSSMSLACARLGWAVQHTPVTSLLTKPVETLTRYLDDGIPFIVLCPDRDTVEEVATYLCQCGYGDTTLDIFSDLGSAEEAHSTVTASNAQDAGTHSDLVLIGITPDHAGFSRAPGLPDSYFDTDGQLTKSEIRALTLSALGPRPGELLWDIGAGSGTISIEWCRLASGARALAFESNPTRARRASHNAHGLPIEVIEGQAPEILQGREQPDAVFVGGGVTCPGVVDRAWDALKPGGRLVINAVTTQSEALVFDRQKRWGGNLVRLEVSRLAELGSFTAWRPALPVVRYSAVKP